MLDREICSDLRDELTTYLNKFGANLDFDVVGMTYGDHAANIKVTAKIKGKRTLKEQKMESGLQKMMKTHRLSRRSKDKTKELVAYDNRKYKYPFIYVDVNSGREYKAPLNTVVEEFSEQ